MLKDGLSVEYEEVQIVMVPLPTKPLSIFFGPNFQLYKLYFSLISISLSLGTLRYQDY